MTTTASPWAYWRPAKVAIGCPNRLEKVINLIRSSWSRAARILSAVRSGDGSREKIISKFGVRVPSKGAIRRMNSSTLPSSLNTGTTTLIDGLVRVSILERLKHQRLVFKYQIPDWPPPQLTPCLCDGP